MNIVIMAGGGGTRLWPLSREDKPKQFLDLGTGKTLLEHTFDRAAAVTSEENIYIATTENYTEKIKELLPGIEDYHVFLEPERRDTGSAIASCAAQLQEQGKGDEPVVFMWSDHFFTNEEAFINDMKRIPELVKENPDQVIIIGHNPTAPETGLGYIELGEPFDSAQGGEVFKVNAFKEKPDADTAKNYLAAGNYVWNMAYVSTTPNYLLDQLKEHEPELASGIDAFIASKPEKRHEAYAALPKIAIDYALLEKTPRLLAIVGDYGWSDVGNWSAVHDVFGQKGDHMPRGHHIHVDSKNNYIYNATDKTVSMLGVSDTIAVVTDDAILITSKDDAARVKEVIEKL